MAKLENDKRYLRLALGSDSVHDFLHGQEQSSVSQRKLVDLENRWVSGVNEYPLDDDGDCR